MSNCGSQIKNDNIDFRMLTSKSVNNTTQRRLKFKMINNVQKS